MFPFCEGKTCFHTISRGDFSPQLLLFDTLIKLLLLLLFSFEVRSQCFSLALTLDQPQQVDEGEIFDSFSCESKELVKTQFRCSCLCFFVRYDSGIERFRMTEAVHNSPFSNIYAERR